MSTIPENNVDSSAYVAPINESYSFLESPVGYSLAAPFYDHWHWTEFWKKNELPLVMEKLSKSTGNLGLDVGSGTGTYSIELAHHQYRMIAIDNCHEMLAVQQQKIQADSPLEKNRPVLLESDCQSIPIISSTFDFAIAARVLSHIHELNRALSEIARVLRIGGSCIVTDIHRSHPNEATFIRADDNVVAIQQYKHSKHELMTAGKKYGLKMYEYTEYTINNLTWEPPQSRFPRIYVKPGHPIFYVCHFVRYN